MPPDSRTRRGGGRADRRFPAGRCRALPRGRDRGAARERPLPRAQSRRRTSPTSRRRSRPATRACRSCTAWSRHFGLAVVEAYMRHVQDNAEERCAACIDRLERRQLRLRDGRRRASSASRSRSTRAARRATIDFTGTSAAARRPISTRRSAVCTAAVLYVFRTLVDDDIPLNGGCLKPLDIVIPEGSMLSPRYPAAVVAGNVETSQCITDALYGALGRDGGGAGHDEQLHLRQRALPVLRDDLRRLRRRARLRRHRCRAHAHDQHAPDRSRGAGMALPGAARELRDPPRLGRARAHGTAATAWCGASASARR